MTISAYFHDTNTFTRNSMANNSNRFMRHFSILTNVKNFLKVMTINLSNIKPKRFQFITKRL